MTAMIVPSVWRQNGGCGREDASQCPTTCQAAVVPGCRHSQAGMAGSHKEQLPTFRSACTLCEDQRHSLHVLHRANDTWC